MVMNDLEQWILCAGIAFATSRGQSGAQVKPAVV